jgi:hypothetical protein
MVHETVADPTSKRATIVTTFDLPPVGICIGSTILWAILPQAVNVFRASDFMQS